jgi:hypothetical protein
MSEHGVDENSEEMLEVSLPALTIELRGSNIATGTNAKGERVLVVGPVLMSFAVPMTDDVARDIGSGLQGGIRIAGADEVPKPRLAIPRGRQR